MIDWYIWLTPLLVLPIAALLIFVGCALTHNALPPPPVVIRLDVDPIVGISGATFTFNVNGGANTIVTLPLMAGTTLPMTTYGTFSAPTANVAHGQFSITLVNWIRGRWIVQCTATLPSAMGNTTLTCPTDPYTRDLIHSSTSTSDEFLYGVDTTPSLHVAHRSF